MKLTKTKLKQIIRETMEETGAMGLPEYGVASGASDNELNDAKLILFDNMKAAREAEQYDIARYIEEAVGALQKALSIIKYNR